MCGITGWLDWQRDVSELEQIIEKMTETLALRGPDAAGTWFSKHCALGHRRLSVIDPANGAQPMIRKAGERLFALVYNGELYNAYELRRELEQRGYHFETNCDTEVLLVSFVEWGPACVERFNGIFAFAIWDELEQQLFLARDRLGVKPLFYTNQGSTFLFGSEPKAILAHPSFCAKVNAEGIAEIFALGPARTPGHGIYQNLSELLPGHCLVVNRNGVSLKAYWKLNSRPHEDDVATTVENVRALLQDTVQRQLVSDVPICMFLSGGLDSSALAAFAAEHYRAANKGVLTTYSVDYIDNDKHFRSNTFQPNADMQWIQRMRDYLGTAHTNIALDTPELVASLYDVVLARDLPGMADVDGSLYLFCKRMKEHFTVAVSGEAADEIFGGYPWFYREDALKAQTFPWSLAVAERASILSREARHWIRPEQYVHERYEQALAEVPHLSGENEAERRIREVAYLNMTRFMPTLLDRKDRMSMAAGLEVRVPFCDHRLVEYIWNIPWHMKTIGNREKGILRKALLGILPEDVLTRKKSPYPKTHNPNYMLAVKARLRDVLYDTSSPILPFIDVPKLKQIVESEHVSSEFPWFGQLMSTPQLFAYLLQVNFWLQRYSVSIQK